MKSLLSVLVAALMGTTLHTLSLTPNAVVGGNDVTATLRLTQDAASGPSIHQVTVSDTSVASAPATVSVPALSTITTFTVRTRGVASRKVVTVSVADANATLGVMPASLVRFDVTPTSVSRGKSVKATLVLNGHAPLGGAVVRLVVATSTGAVNPPGFGIRPSVTIPGDSFGHSFEIEVAPTAAPGRYTISATFGQAVVRQSVQVL